MLCHMLRDATSVWLVALSILVLSPVSGQKEPAGNVRNSSQGKSCVLHIIIRNMYKMILIVCIVINYIKLEIMNLVQVSPSGHAL